MSKTGDKIAGEFYGFLEGIASWLGLSGLVRRLSSAIKGKGWKDPSEYEIVNILNTMIDKASSDGVSKLEQLERKFNSFPIMTNYTDRTSLAQRKKELAKNIKDQGLRNDLAETELNKARTNVNKIINADSKSIIANDIDNWEQQTREAVNKAENIVKGIETYV